MDGSLLLYVIPFLLALYLFLKLLFNPLGFLARLLTCVVTGAAMVAVFNVIIGLVGLHIAFNVFTILVAGILYVPGLVLLLIMSQWLV